jgi:hypothetical protein
VDIDIYSTYGIPLFDGAIKELIVIGSIGAIKAQAWHSQVFTAKFNQKFKTG